MHLLSPGRPSSGGAGRLWAGSWHNRGNTAVAVLMGYWLHWLWRLRMFSPNSSLLSSEPGTIGAGSQHTRPAERAARWMFIQSRQPGLWPEPSGGRRVAPAGRAWTGGPSGRFPKVWIDQTYLLPRCCSARCFSKFASCHRSEKSACHGWRCRIAFGRGSKGYYRSRQQQRRAAGGGQRWQCSRCALCPTSQLKQVGGCYGGGREHIRAGRLPRVAVAERRSLQAGGPSASKRQLHDPTNTMER